jgi:diguanylate cyclase (GGDEF)-like protein/PAS domain S-box-containing protein
MVASQEPCPEISPKAEAASRDRMAELEAECALLKQSVARAEAQLRAQAANALEMRYTVSNKGLLLTISDNGASSLGYAREELVGAPLRSFVHSEDIQILQAYVNLAIKTGALQKGIEYRIRSKDNGYRWWYSNGCAVRDEQGKLLWYSASALDITAVRALKDRLKENDHRLQLAASAMGAYLWELDVPSGDLRPSALMYRDLGYQDSALPRRREDLFQLMHPNDTFVVREALDNHLSGRTGAYNVECRLLSTKGKWTWFRSAGQVMEHAADGSPLRLLGIFTDITKSKRAAEALRRSERNLETILEASPVGVAVLREDGAILFCNGRFAQMTNIGPDLLMNMRIHSFYADPKRHDQLMEQFKEHGQVTDEEGMFKLPGGRHFWALLTMTSIVYEGSKAILFWTYDISELKKAEAKLRELATTDSLTGIFNRRRFMELASRELSLSLRNHRPVSLLMLDADRFKNVNDTYGHDVGDMVLRSLAAVCKKMLRDVDVFGRLGGEEFAALLPETNKEGAVFAAERLRRALESTHVEHAGGKLSYTVSIGVTTAKEDTPDVESMLKEADAALYQAKQKGRNRVESS